MMEWNEMLKCIIPRNEPTEYHPTPWRVRTQRIMNAEDSYFIEDANAKRVVAGHELTKTVANIIVTCVNDTVKRS